MIDTGPIEGARVWRDLESRLRPFVARRVHREVDVDDVVQDVFLRMQRGISGLRDDERFGPWVYQVARSAIAEHQRQAARHPLAAPELQSAAELTATEDDDDSNLVAGEMASCAAFFVTFLPSPYREALTLTELEGLTHHEAAAMIGISVSGMKSRVQRGRRKLRAALEECCHIALDARRRVVASEPRTHACDTEACRSATRPPTA